MSMLIPQVEPGDLIKADDWNAILEALIALEARIATIEASLGPQDRPAPALFTYVENVRRQPVADINHRVQVRSLLQGQSFMHPRREIQVLAQNAAAQGSGDEQPIPGLGPFS